MNAAGLAPGELQELADQLRSRRQELNELIESLQQVTGTRHDCNILDIADSASLNEMRLRAATLIRQHSNTIAEIDAALARLRDGRFGISEVSGEPIRYERLRVVPWARTAAGE